MEIVSTGNFRTNQNTYSYNVEDPKLNLTERICRGLREIKMIREGKLKPMTMEELLSEL